MGLHLIIISCSLCAFVCACNRLQLLKLPRTLMQFSSASSAKGMISTPHALRYIPTLRP